MTKKTNKSAHSEQHKKPMEPSLLEEEFGTEMGDYNSAKFIDAFAEKKAKACKKSGKQES
ncbi:hypothetical protein [Peribacillus frigoritolerans]|uniref:hypothetical protein n=1 Tax=Peribacillus frigoritolerans TaxID=450367 RepID=UPI00105966E6|nr:hypothetical protein [Peribacillus frigoritolerans]TDL80249.1 hypothetical protein E2R53_09455 [Peribacillus frigoritolerans]